MIKKNIKNYTLPQLENLMDTIGEKKFRAKQIFRWTNKGVYDYEEMNNIPLSTRKKLEEEVFVENISITEKYISSVDNTRKYLFTLRDGNIIESVFMKYNHGNTVCISSQAGCRMGCFFCASTIGGLKRNLDASEMLEQVLKIQIDTTERISNIVIMGSGEPFENYEQLINFLKIVNDKEGLNISLRNITVSTCGLVPLIIKFAHEMPQVTLAISLHAPNDEIRNSIMPINKKYNLHEIMKASKEYINITNKRITFEYSLIKGLNDTTDHAKELATRLKGLLCHVNIIPLNEVEEREFKSVNRKRAEEFKQALSKFGINATIRRELGGDIDAACGQLRSKHL